MSAAREARRLEVRGIVQGVGFRPFVWRLAAAHHVRGWVRNDGGRVTVHAEGAPADLDTFAQAIRDGSPPLARVDDVVSSPAAVEGHEAFTVDESAETRGAVRMAPPDAATCDACLDELFDPGDRRFRYPFINCTDCGPRYTIIEALPYDRERTSMRGFAMCAACRAEYEDPGDRRFHAEPIACPACGPSAHLLDREGRSVQHPRPDDPAAAIVAAAHLLRDGAIVALKGLGGFHLACDATDEAAVARLRARKRRLDRPLAVMVADLAEARAWFAPSEAQAAALSSWRAPITLVPDRGRLARLVAPGHHRGGVMLPSTPLHHLVLRVARRPLVMTSGNVSDEPICLDGAEALGRLGRIADAFVLHDRPIVSRYDDSVVLVRTRDDRPSVLRRARSQAPEPIPLPIEVAPTLGTGAELHAACCLAQGDRAFLSQHVGDLTTLEMADAYRAALDRLRHVLGIEPQVVAHDLHPDLFTTTFAEQLGLPRIAVQHHHAHVAATMAELGIGGEVLGLAFDGLGLGDDGTIWGGELLACTPATYRRLGRLRPVRQPGGDAATRAPWRMALAHAADAGAAEHARRLLGAVAAGEEAEVVRGQLRSGLASPWTSSVGRLFDAVAALTGVCRDRATYEGHPAILLEQAATAPVPLAPLDLADVGGLLELDPRPTIADTVARLTAGAAPGQVAAGFHVALADATARACRRIRERTGLDRVVLGGGVFQNDRFTSELGARLRAAGFRIALPRMVPVGDGGLAVGQVYVAGAQMAPDRSADLAAASTRKG